MSTTETTIRDKRTTNPLHITAVELNEGTGWYRIETDGVPKDLKTQKEEIARLASGHKQSGALIAVSYTHTEKPSGRDFPPKWIDDYFDNAEVVVEQQLPLDDGITRVRSSAPEKSPQEAWRIALSVGSERAVQMIPYLREDQQRFPFLWALAHEWAARIYLTQPPTSLEPLVLPPVGGAEDGAQGNQSDDDIPF